MAGSIAQPGNFGDRLSQRDQTLQRQGQQAPGHSGGKHIPVVSECLIKLYFLPGWLVSCLSVGKDGEDLQRESGPRRKANNHERWTESPDDHLEPRQPADPSRLSQRSHPGLHDERRQHLGLPGLLEGPHSYVHRRE